VTSPSCLFLCPATSSTQRPRASRRRLNRRHVALPLRSQASAGRVHCLQRTQSCLQRVRCVRSGIEYRSAKAQRTRQARYLLGLQLADKRSADETNEAMVQTKDPRSDLRKRCTTMRCAPGTSWLDTWQDEGCSSRMERRIARAHRWRGPLDESLMIPPG
jgi:hypothetical protein